MFADRNPGHSGWFSDGQKVVRKTAVKRTGDVLGDARVSTVDWDAAGQHDQLEEACRAAKQFGIGRVERMQATLRNKFYNV